MQKRRRSFFRTNRRVIAVSRTSGRNTLWFSLVFDLEVVRGSLPTLREVIGKRKPPLRRFGLGQLQKLPRGSRSSLFRELLFLFGASGSNRRLLRVPVDNNRGADGWLPAFGGTCARGRNTGVWSSATGWLGGPRGRCGRRFCVDSYRRFAILCCGLVGRGWDVYKTTVWQINHFICRKYYVHAFAQYHIAKLRPIAFLSRSLSIRFPTFNTSRRTLALLSSEHAYVFQWRSNGARKIWINMHQVRRCYGAAAGFSISIVAVIKVKNAAAYFQIAIKWSVMYR